MLVSENQKPCCHIRLRHCSQCRCLHRLTAAPHYVDVYALSPTITKCKNMNCVGQQDRLHQCNIVNVNVRAVYASRLRTKVSKSRQKWSKEHIRSHNVSGNMFQDTGPATEKARQPNIKRRAGGSRQTADVDEMTGYVSTDGTIVGMETSSRSADLSTYHTAILCC